jgi:glyoxylase-like metal-dependent hydrolase (beta-lactamase superfamily II)
LKEAQLTTEAAAKQDADAVLDKARSIVGAAKNGEAAQVLVQCFFDEPTFTASYVVHDPTTKKAGIIDSVLDFDVPSGRTSHASADAIIAYVRDKNLEIEWLLETHAHADHLSAAPYLQQALGGKIAIGREIVTVQETFGALFNAGPDFARDGSQFDRLFDDGDPIHIGEIDGVAMHVPGHTPADLAYVIGDAAFIGDTLFMPDYGTARTDFPGGDAATLYRSIRRLLLLPAETRLFLCHDYKAPGRDEFAWETTAGDERVHNIHVHNGVTEEEFVAMRAARDATLSMPRLILPAIQVNMRGGHMPEPEDNGTRYLKLPLDAV